MAIRTDILEAIARTQTRHELFNELHGFFKSQGFNAFTYIIPKPTGPGEVAIYERGLPQEWVARYRATEAWRIDPVQQHAALATEIFKKTDVTLHTPLDKAQDELVWSARHAGLTDGLVIPTQGRLIRSGRFTLTCAASPEAVEKADRPLLEAVARQAHHRFDRCLAEKLQLPSLSPREVEILHWIGAGKTNAEIAIILDIALPTVATYVKRLFQKLDVTDRVSAAVKGLKFGLVNV